MNKNLDEVYITLLKAKEKIYEYTKNKVKNENWRPYYNGIVEKDGTLYYVIRKDQGAKSITKVLSEAYKIELLEKNKGFYIYSAKL